MTSLHFTSHHIMSENDVLKAQTQWFHMLKSMVDGGDLAKMEGSTVKVYLVIKSCANFDTGESFPGIPTIGKLAGLSKEQTMRCITELEKFGFVTKQKVGRQNKYALRETVEIFNPDGEKTAVASYDYAPASAQNALREIKNMMISGDLGGAKFVHIERLIVQINGTTGTQFNDSDLAKLPVDMQEALLRLKENLK